MSHRTQDEARAASDRLATRAAVVLSFLIIVAALLSGCGGGGDNPPSDSTECHNDAVTGARVCTDTKGQSK